MSVKQLLITGASGFVGQRAKLFLSSTYQLLTPSHHEMDITDIDSVFRYIASYKPDVILHCAALSNTGYCEEHPKESYAINVLGTLHLARAAQNIGAKFLFFSSDQVYNGCCELGLLNEEEKLAPENYYACHKLEAEQEALLIDSSAVALRATWMYDCNRVGLRPHANFVLNLKAAISEGRELAFATREYRGITWVQEVVENIPALFSLKGGVYNYGSENLLNTYETAAAYLKMIAPTVNIDRIIRADEVRFSSHVRNISISLDKIKRESNGAIQFRNTIDGFRFFEEQIASLVQIAE
ncbi:MAG: SDR family oxidoreductase [Phocaeicola sp.]